MTPLECKYTKWYYNIVSSNKIRPPNLRYTETHHIIPRCLGGSDDESNLVKLTAKQHFICHLLLTKMFIPNTYEHFKMLHAFCMMDRGTCNAKMQRYTSRIHEKQRQQFSEYLRLKQLGTNNNQYGTIWIYNDELKECKKINKTDCVPTGWKKGRVLNWVKHFQQQLKQKRNIIKNCIECGVTLNNKSPLQTFCTNGKCGNSYRFKNAKTVMMYRGNETKEVKVQNVPAYKKYGWRTWQDSNLH